MKTDALFKTAMVVLCLIAAVALAPAPVNAASVTLSYANFPPASTFPCVQMERWAREIEKRTNNQVKINTFPGGTLLPAKNIFDGVIAGTADIGNFAMSYQPGRFPVSEAVDLPLGIPSARVASLVLYDLIDKYQPKEFEKVKILTLFTCPPADFMTSKPVRTLKDLKGMELRVSGTGADVVKNLGGIPIAMPQSDTPEAIQKGIVKGVVSSLEVLKDMNYAAYCPYATDTSLFVVSFAVVMNKDKWNALPADVKKVMDDMRIEQAEWTGQYVDDHVTEALTWSKQKYNHEVIQLSAADKAEIRKLVRPMIDAYVKKVSAQGLPGAEIITETEKLTKKHDRKK
jgi:TRAP-type C4-dicarboxylate transport system substrate-binding protein